MILEHRASYLNKTNIIYYNWDFLPNKEEAHATEDRRFNGLKTKNFAPKSEQKQLVDTTKTRQQEAYSALVKLLDTLKRNRKISAIEWRRYSKQWRDYPQHREFLLKQLELIGK